MPPAHSRPESPAAATLSARAMWPWLAEAVTYADLETAGTVVLVGLEAEEEAPLIFLRLRKAVRKKGLVVKTIAAIVSSTRRIMTMQFASEVLFIGILAK